MTESSADSTGPTWRGRYLRVDVLYSTAGLAQHITVRSETTCLLVDVGDGALRDLLGAGVSLSNIDGVLITHGHFDHMGGLWTLLGFMRMVGRRAPLAVVAPAGCAEVLKTVGAFLDIYGDTLPFRLDLNEASGGQEMLLGDVTATAHEVMHCGSIVGGGVLERIPALGYRLGCRGETVAITGDTGREADLEALVSGADLALIEATFDDGAEVSDEKLRRVHLSQAEARRLGALAAEHRLIHRAPARREGRSQDAR